MKPLPGPAETCSAVRNPTRHSFTRLHLRIDLPVSPAPQGLICAARAATSGHRPGILRSTALLLRVQQREQQRTDSFASHIVRPMLDAWSFVVSVVSGAQ